MRSLLKVILRVLAKRVIRRYHPLVIGITGSVGKTTAKEAIAAVLSPHFWVAKNEENFNNEFGVPFAILRINPKNFSAVGHKLLSLGSAVWLALGPRRAYPRLLVLELAADRPGDIGYLVQIVRPSVGVVTAVGEVPVHVQFYASPKQIAKEKAKLIQSLQPSAQPVWVQPERRLLPRASLAVLNYDDPVVLAMRISARAKVVSFGLTDGADLRAAEINYFISDENGRIGGLAFKLHQGKSFVPLRLNNVIASHQIYAVLAAAAVGLHCGLTLVDISHAVENFQPPKGRMNLLRGIRGSIVIDDSYNAAPASAQAALETLAGFSGAAAKLTTRPPRRLAVLGDMRELGRYEEGAHRHLGALAGERCDYLVTVGPAAKFIADVAAPSLGPDKVQSFLTAAAAAPALRQLVQAGDIVLIKGSRALQMEQLVAEIAIK